MLIDCHIHTNRFSDCSVLEPHRACERAIQRGLDAIVLTEHQVQWPLQPLSVLRNAYPRLAIYSGAEITLAEGFDVVLIAEEQNLSFPPFPQRIPFQKLQQRLSTIEGDTFLFIAHPFRWTTELSRPMEGVLSRVQGIEMNSINILRGKLRQEGERFLPEDNHLYIQAQEKFGLVPLFNTDSHSEKTVGIIASLIDGSPPRGGSALASMLKRSRPAEYQDEQLLHYTMART